MMGPIGYPEISVRNYNYSLCNNPEERSSHLLHSGHLKSRIVCQCVYYVEHAVTPFTLPQQHYKWV